MILAQRNSSAVGGKMAPMSAYNEDSIGRRIAWARKNVDWIDNDGKRHIGMTGHQLGRRLVTQGTATGVRNVYVSQLENNHASPSLAMLRKIAEVTGVTVGFLLMETDYPYRDKPEPEEPAYLSPEADAAAELIDNVLDTERRKEMLSVVRTMAWHAQAEEIKQQATEPAPVRGGKKTAAQRDSFASRLIHSDKVGHSQAGERARL